MIHINHQLLVEIGLGHLDRDQQNHIMGRIYEVLQHRVGVVLAGSLTAAQRDVFQRATEDPEIGMEYLEHAIPDYAVVVRRELNVIVASIAEGLHRTTTVPSHVSRNERDDVQSNS